MGFEEASLEWRWIADEGWAKRREETEDERRRLNGDCRVVVGEGVTLEDVVEIEVVDISGKGR